MTEQEVQFKSLRTVYLLVGIAAAYAIGAVARGDYYLSIMVAGVIAGVIAVVAAWVFRNQWWMTNWWDL